MRYRKLDANNDYSFGNGAADFWVNQPEGVGQAVLTRLELQLGEFWLDTSDGTPWLTQVLGTGTQQRYDQAIQLRILGTQGAVSLDKYDSFKTGRALTIQGTLTTIYSASEQVQIQKAI